MTIDQIEKWNDYLMHAPTGAVVALFAVALGWALTWAQFFPNRYVPLAIVLATAALFPAAQLCNDVRTGAPHPGLNIVTNVMLGFVIGFAGWWFGHYKLQGWLAAKGWAPTAPPGAGGGGQPTPQEKGEK